MDDKLSPPVVEAEIVEETMDFPDAIRQVIRGQKIARKSWTDKSSFGVLLEGFLTIYINEGFHKWLVNDGDMEGTDWIIVRAN